MGGLFMLILKDPAFARRFGILSTKAQLAGSAADWPAYFGILAQATAVGGSIVFGLVVIWLFGREYSDRTVKDLLALPTTRAEIIVAKCVVLVIWTAMLTALLIVLSLGIGGVIGLPGWSVGLALYSAAQIGFVAILTLALVIPLAWVASAGRGYALDMEQVSNRLPRLVFAEVWAILVGGLQVSVELLAPIGVALAQRLRNGIGKCSSALQRAHLTDRRIQSLQSAQ
jgi:hypothetical protein